MSTPAPASPKPVNRRMKFAWFLLDRLRHLGRGTGRNVGFIINSLRASGLHFTCDAVALTAVEMTFRPRWTRAMEYVWWIFLSQFGTTKRLGKLSLGPSQLQLRHWMRMGYIGQLGFSRAALRVVSHIDRNIEATERFLREEDLLEREGPELMRRWTGGDRKDFVELLEEARRQVRGRMSERVEVSR
jgi:hypothetical protein